MSVVRSATFAFANTAGPSATTGAATPTAGDVIIGVTQIWNQGSASVAPTISGTGTYTALIPFFSDSAQGDMLFGINASATAGSQTVTGTGHSTSVGSANVWAAAFTGANAATCTGSHTERNAPGTGTGALVGTAVTVPAGGVLYCIALDSFNGSGAIAAAGGATQVDANSSFGYCVSQYTGTGASITPSFTVSGTSGSSPTLDVWQILIPPAALPTSVSYFAAAPQQVDSTQQAFFDAPQPASITARVARFFTALPQILDPVQQQAFFDAPQPAGAKLRVASFFTAAPQSLDATQQSFFDAPQPAGATLRVARFFTAAPQTLDLTQQAFFDASQPVANRVASFVTGSPQRIDLTQQAFFDAPKLAAVVAVACVSSYITAGPQAVDLTQQAFYDAPPAVGVSGSVPSADCQYGLHAVVLHNAEAAKTKVWPSAIAASVITGKLGSWVGSLPQFEERPTVVAYAVQQSGFTPRIIPVTIVPEQSYVNLQPSVTRSVVANGAFLGAVVKVGQQSYVDLQPSLYPSSVAGSTSRVGVFFSAGPVDTSQLAAFVKAPLPGQLPVIGPVPGQVRSAPQSVDLTLQAFFDAPQPAGATLRVVSFFTAAPQVLDASQQAFWDAPQPGLLKGPVPPLLIAAPQFVDLTLQGSFSKPLITGQGKLGTYVGVPQQQFDYTQPSYTINLITLQTRVVYVVPQRVELDDYGRYIVLGGYGKRIFGS